MRNLILTLATTATLLVGGLMLPDTAEARPRWRGGYYSPAGRYYRPYYGRYYGPRYYRSYYGPRYYGGYYGSGYRYSWGGPGFYFRF
jgi:hypothetical protein